MNTFDKKAKENDCEQKGVSEDKLEQKMAFAVEKEEEVVIHREQKTDPVIQMGKVNNKKTRTSNKSRMSGAADMGRLNGSLLLLKLQLCNIYEQKIKDIKNI